MPHTDVDRAGQNVEAGRHTPPDSFTEKVGREEVKSETDKRPNKEIDHDKQGERHTPPDSFTENLERQEVKPVEKEPEVKTEWIDALSKGTLPDDLKKALETADSVSKLTDAINKKLTEAAKAEGKEQRYSLDYRNEKERHTIQPFPTPKPGVRSETVSLIDQQKKAAEEAADEAAEKRNPQSDLQLSRQHLKGPAGVVDSITLFPQEKLEADREGLGLPATANREDVLEARKLADDQRALFHIPKDAPYQDIASARAKHLAHVEASTRVSVNTARDILGIPKGLANSEVLRIREKALSRHVQNP